ncbi:MAG TPA: hypothetical protein VGF26_21615 [Ramlibacter sp.]
MQRSTTLALSVLALVAGCATQSTTTQSEASCDQATVPAAAVLGVRDGIDIATYPPEHPRGFTGCQRVWYGEHQRRDAMRVLATYYYEQGQVRRLVGQVPGGQAYDCRYRDGALDQGQSRNPGVCPDATKVEQVPIGR